MRANSGGFTLIELIIAMALFSLTMLILSVGVVQIGKIYRQGISSKRTQQAARLVIEDITREVRGANRIEVNQTGPDELCIRGATTVYYQRDVVSGSVNKYTGTACGPGGNEETLVEGNALIKARQFVADAFPDTDPTSVRVTILVSTGEEDLLANDVCKPGAGSQFCATTTYTNVVSMRGGS